MCPKMLISPTTKHWKIGTLKFLEMPSGAKQGQTRPNRAEPAKQGQTGPTGTRQGKTGQN